MKTLCVWFGECELFDLLAHTFRTERAAERTLWTFLGFCEIMHLSRQEPGYSFQDIAAPAAVRVLGFSAVIS